VAVASPPTAAPRSAPVALDRAIIQRFRGGDREAFLIVYDAHAALVRPLVARFFARPFEREEAVQEVWLLVVRMAASFDPDRGDLAAWLRALAANRCKELLRARGRRPNADTALGDDDLVAPSDPERLARAERLRAVVARFEAVLAGDEAAVFRLSLLEERSHEEVARAAAISVRRCKYLRMKLLARAALQPELRRALGEVTEP